MRAMTRSEGRVIASCRYRQLLTRYAINASAIQAATQNNSRAVPANVRCDAGKSSQAQTTPTKPPPWKDFRMSCSEYYYFIWHMKCEFRTMQLSYMGLVIWRHDEDCEEAMYEQDTTPLWRHRGRNAIPRMWCNSDWTRWWRLMQNMRYIGIREWQVCVRCSPRETRTLSLPPSHQSWRRIEKYRPRNSGRKPSPTVNNIQPAMLLLL